MSNELHQLLSELIEVWPGEHTHPVVERARTYLEEHSAASDSENSYHQMTTYDGWKPNSNEMWYSV